MQINYRIADLADLEEIFGLVTKAIETMDEQGIFQWDELYPDREILQEDILKKELYVGIIDKQIAVIYVLNQECDEEYKNGKWKFGDKPFCVIHRLCVNPVFQNKGVAGKVMLHIEQEVLLREIAVIRLDAFTQNPHALKLYEHLGYSKVGDVHWRKGRFYLMEKYLDV